LRSLKKGNKVKKSLAARWKLCDGKKNRPYVLGLQGHPDEVPKIVRKQGQSNGGRTGGMPGQVGLPDPLTAIRMSGPTRDTSKKNRGGCSSGGDPAGSAKNLARGRGSRL